MTAATLSLAQLEAFDPHAPDRGGIERRFLCPLPACEEKKADASHRSLAVAVRTGAWLCHRCGATGKLQEWWQDRPRESRKTRQRRQLRAAFDLAGRIEKNISPNGEIGEIQEKLLRPLAKLKSDDWQTAWREQLKDVVRLAGTPGEAYLLGRGIPIELAHAAGVRYAASWYGRPAVVFPVRDRARHLVAAQGRYLTDDHPKVRTAGPVGLGVFSTPDAWDEDPLIIVEAPICALTLAAACFPAVALCGASNCPAWLPQACAFKRVFIALDKDDAGDKAAERLAAQLRPLAVKVERLRPPAKDWNAARGTGLTAALAAVFAD